MESLIFYCFGVHDDRLVMFRETMLDPHGTPTFYDKQVVATFTSYSEFSLFRRTLEANRLVTVEEGCNRNEIIKAFREKGFIK
jgi:hypothetical protein